MAQNIITRTADFFISGKFLGGAKKAASNTVDSILSQFVQAVADLEKLQEDQSALIEANDGMVKQLEQETKEKVKQLNDESQAAAKESLRAAKAADKIRALLA